jgi:hypothetical protein
MILQVVAWNWGIDAPGKDAELQDSRSISCMASAGGIQLGTKQCRLF